MAFLLVSLLLAIYSRKVNGANCDLGAADVIFVVKATHLMQREDFDYVKGFMKSFSENLDIGRDSTSTHVGVVFFDNIGPAQTRIPIQAFGRLSDLHMAIDNLSLLPCGAEWCKEKETSFRPALDYAMSRFPKGRMKKIVLIHSGREESAVTNDLSELTIKDPWLRTLHIYIKGNIVRQGDQETTYLAAYHDPYKRYAERMAQLYTNLSIPIPDPPTPIAPPKTVEQGRITVEQSLNLLKINEEVCKQLFSCPPCGVTGGMDPFDKETPIHSKLPQNWKTQVTPAKKVNSGGTEDYEYEITGDPPGLKINQNPALEKAKRTASTPEPETADYLYEDSAPERKSKKRNKRAVMSPLQRDCSCGVQISSQQDGPPSIEPPTVSKAAEGCSGSSASAEASGCGGAVADGCTSTGGGDCGGAVASQATYAQPAHHYQYYQYPMTQYQYEQQYQHQYYPQYYNQYRSPCRVGNPCQPRPYYYPYPRSPCASRSPCSAQQYYYPQQYQYYGYTYSQTGLPSQQQPQPQAESYATPASVLPSMDNVHDGTSQDQKPKDQKPPEKFKFDNSIFDKLEKYDKELEKDAKPPTDPFNVRAFGGSQLKRIPTASILETIFESLSNATPPPIEDILGKFPEPVAQGFQESEATIPLRPVTLKPIDLGSDMSEMRKRSRRSIKWSHHPWHYHMHNHVYNNFYRFRQPAYWTDPSGMMARAHAAPLFTANQVPIPLSQTVPTWERECLVKGTDLAVYIDDVGSMSPSEFNTVKVYLKLVWRLLETNKNHCQEMSRMSILKTSKKGDLLVHSSFDHASTTVSKETLIDSMVHSSCSIRHSVCDQTLPRALIMASNLLWMQPTDREKLVIVISSRPSSSLDRLFESLIEARDFMRQNRVGLIYVSMREGDSPVGINTTLQNLLKTVCQNAPDQGKLYTKKKFCPWRQVPVIGRAFNSTQQIFR